MLHYPTFRKRGCIIVVQYVLCSEEEEGHLKCTGLFGRFSWTLSTLRVGLHVDCHGRFQVFVFDRIVAFESSTDRNSTAPLVVESWYMRSLSSRTGNTSTYIPASSTFLILLLMLRVFPLYLHYDLRRCFVSN